MRGIPDIQAVIERSDKAGRVAFCRLDTRTHVRMSVRVDCSIDADTTGASRSNVPDYAAHAYRLGASPTIVPVVRYPRCAGWDEGFGASYGAAPGFSHR